MHFPCMTTDKLQISFLNVRSLHKHIDHVRSDHNLQHCQIQMYCETRVSQQDPTDMYKLDSYQDSMYPTPSQTGVRSHYGLALYSKLRIIHTEQVLMMSNSSHTECAVMSVEVDIDVLLTVACLYRRPNSDLPSFHTLLDQLTQTIHTIQSRHPYTHQHTIIMGDFNLDWNDKSVRSAMSHSLPNFTQMITQTTNDYGSVIDHAYTDIHSDHVQCLSANLITLTANHCMLFSIYQLHHNPQITLGYVTQKCCIQHIKST